MSYVMRDYRCVNGCDEEIERLEMRADRLPPPFCPVCLVSMKSKFPTPRFRIDPAAGYIKPSPDPEDEGKPMFDGIGKF